MTGNRGLRAARGGGHTQAMPAGLPRIHSKLAGGVLLALPLVGCGPAEPPPEPPREAAVSVVPVALELRAGETAQLAAQVNDDAGQPIGGAEIVFTSDAVALADVTRDGLVTATGPVGSTQLRVASGRAEVRVPVTVVAGRAHSIAVQQGPPGESVAEGTTAVLVLRVQDAFGNAVPGVELQFVALAGDGAVSVPAATTDARGTVHVDWKLGAGEQVLEARAADLAPLVLSALTTHTILPTTMSSSRDSGT